MSSDPVTLTVSQLLARLTEAVAAAVPGPIWVRGEVSGLKRTSRGAVFFRLVDPDRDNQVLEVAARGRIMLEVDRLLDAAGVGGVRDGIEVRVRAVVSVDPARSLVRLSLLEVDPEFTAGRLAIDRAAVIKRLAADGALEANGRLSVPLVPLRVGLVTSRGSAAHADFLDQLRRSGYRFSVRTVHASMQGESSAMEVARAVERLGAHAVDVVVVVRGGGSKLDLAAFDQEVVGRAVAAATVPVVVGIGHETDRTVIDEVAARSEKTPSAAGEWLVSRVGEFAGRVDTARRLIADEARTACRRASSRLDHAAALLGGVSGALAAQRDQLRHTESSLAERARTALSRQHELLESLESVVGAVGIDATLGRGFALVTDADGRVVRAASGLSAGDMLGVRFGDGSVRVRVEEVG